MTGEVLGHAVAQTYNTIKKETGLLPEQVLVLTLEAIRIGHR